METDDKKLLIGKNIVKDVKVFSNPEHLKLVIHPIRWKILELLSRKEMYALQIAKELKIHEQKIYYHIKKLKKAGAIKEKRKQEMKGGIATFYSCEIPVFAVELGFGKIKLKSRKIISSKLRNFFREFDKKGNFDSYIVVGSPDPHGPYKQYARDGHYIGQLGLFLGQMFSMPKEFVVKLDIDIKSEAKLENNMILVGGPISNVVTSEIMENMPVKFGKEIPRKIIGKSEHSGDTVGIIAKIKNPFDKTKTIILIAGTTAIGTKSAILALTKFWKQILDDYDNGKDFIRIIQGFDLDGDGKIDSVEVLE